MKILSLLCLCFVAAGLHAQSEISATVVDTTGTTLPGANAILLRTSDTLLTSFGTTNNKGVFIMQNVPAGEYILRVSFLGFERPDQPLTITASDQYLGLGELRMYPAGFQLTGVEVTADRIPIRMKGDTMLYDAEAFAVGENAKVEDLLRRLPGMSIDANGQLTWRGKPVQEVMINGKPFFAGNSTLVTQNLDAKALKNVEVFDQKSDNEEITGIDDGEENTTVNLEMKEEFKAKVFGELYGGVGTSGSTDDQRYDAGGKLFRISDATQIGVLATINNVNRVGFTGDELMNFNRSSGRGSWYSTGGQGSLPYYDGGQTPGQNRSIAAGVNFGRTVGENGQLTMDYTLFDRKQAQLVVERQAFTRANNRRTVSSAQRDASTNYSHRVSFEYEHELDTISRLTVEGAGYFSGNENRGLAVTEVTSDDVPSDEYTVEELSDGLSPGGNVGMRYNTRLGGKRGRTFGANASGSYAKNQTDLEVLTEGLDENGSGSLAIAGSLQNGLQLQNRRTNSVNLNGEVNYTEPLTEKLRLETELGYGFDEDEGDYRFRLDEESTVNLLTRRWTSLRGGTGLIYRYGERNNLQAGLDVQRNSLQIMGDTARLSNYTYLLPNLGYRVNAGKANIRFRYNSRVQTPSVQQLQTIARPSLTGRVTVGNPDLDPAVNHNLSANFWFNDQFRALNFYGSFGGGYTDNAFGNSLTFTSNQQIYQTVNVSHAWNNYAYVGSTIGMAFMNGELRLNANSNGSRGQGFVEGLARTNISRNLSASGDLTTEFNEKTFLKAGYTYSQNVNSFDDEESVDIVTVTHDLLAQFELEVSPKWRLETRFLYRIFEAASFAGATNIPDLRARVELRPFKKAGHYFVLGGEDLLNQNTVINRQAQAFVTTETISNGLGRYFLATFHYQL
ncbi:outer membrane beta-barrel protein [Neolewinella litorea]|uniref:TonB-dependent receptor n=1 Tax=Neolewinella litorea TaxID=2562452 RepID=A0A4V3XLN8_9BACT|nr:outer membrane beta-barrel protein [Neolewinella litorea]THH41613.1 TonB-dependent receptor [Neolewinella litorea]